jgi:hypothetical protein
MSTALLFPAASKFYRVRDGHPIATAIYNRHYSAKPNRKSKQIVGPGASILLITHDDKALIVWREFIDDCIDPRTGQKQQGINCAVFRNEGTSAGASSELLLEAQQIAWQKWPAQRLYTYVDASKIKPGNPGYCFKKAGWRNCGRSKGGLVILEHLAEMEVPNA